MSINFSYRRLSQGELDELLAGSAEIYKKWFGPADLGADDVDDEFEALYERLEQSKQYLDINNTWQAIHFLLTDEFCFQGQSQTPPPLRNVVMGGVPTDIETTYGVAFYLTAPEVAEAAKGLEPLTVEEMAPRFNAKAFREAKVYPGNERWQNDDFEEFATEYENLRGFFLVAARENQAMLLAS